VPPVIETAQDRLEDLNEVLHPQPPVGDSMPGFDVGEEVSTIIHEWRDEISSEQVRTDYASQLASRTGGRDLTEGALLYKRGHLAGDARSFNRALGIFANLLNNNADALVALVARAYLQLSYYRSGRLGKVPSVDIPPLPTIFSRLEAEMHGLAWMCGAVQHALGSQDGLGFSDISPLDADRILEDEIQARIVNPPPLVVSEMKNRLPPSEQAHESQSEKSPTRSLGTSAPVKILPGPGSRKLHKGPRCPLCLLRFEFYIDMTAHLQSGCKNPRAPIRHSRRKREKANVRLIYHRPGPPEMTKCSYCGCPVRHINLSRHLGRCPKYPKKDGSSIP